MPIQQQEYQAEHAQTGEAHCQTAHSVLNQATDVLLLLLLLLQLVQGQKGLLVFSHDGHK
jgi:hypothetical protein